MHYDLFLFQNDTKSGDETINIEENANKKPKVIKIILHNKSDIINCSIFVLITAYFAWATHYYLDKTGKYRGFDI